MATSLAASVGALAGCPSGDQGTATPGEDPTPTSTPDSMGEGTATATPSDTPTATDTETATPQGPPVTDTAGSYLSTVPEQSFLYEYGPSGSINNAGLPWVIELCLPYRQGTTDFQTSGQTWDLGEMGKHKVACWLEDYEIEPPYDWTEHYDDRLTYWNDTPLDANARKWHEMIAYYGEGLGKFSDGKPTYEVQDQWTMHLWRTTGEVEGTTANPANQFKIELTNVGMYYPPPHPEFTEPRAKKLKNASTKKETNNIWSNIQSEPVTFFDFAENGWGSGLYEARSRDDVSNSEMLLHAREDHPNYTEETIPKINLRVATSDRQDVLRNQGKIDIDQGVISEESGSVNRQTLPDYIQQLSVTGSGALFGSPFNWNSELGNLWVRRAFVTAVDWNNVGKNCYGPDGYIPMKHQTGTTDSIAETWLSQDFLDKLHDWPMKSDPETAAQYMRKAGYSKQGGTWVRPNGEEAQLLAKTSAGYGQAYVVAVQTIKSQLDSWGLPVKFENVSTQAFNTARDNMTYDFVWQWNNQRSPFEAYTGAGGWWSAKIMERDPDFPNSFDGWDDGRWPDNEPVENKSGEVQPPDKVDLRGQPLNMQLPKKVGNVKAPERAGKSPDLSGNGIDAKEINLLSHIQELNKDPGLTEDRLNTLLEDMAWYANYYLPDFWPLTITDGVMGNVRDFNWAPRGSTALKTNSRLGANMRQYQSQAGLVFKKYNEDYEPPS